MFRYKWYAIGVHSFDIQKKSLKRWYRSIFCIICGLFSTQVKQDVQYVPLLLVRKWYLTIFDFLIWIFFDYFLWTKIFLSKWRQFCHLILIEFTFGKIIFPLRRSRLLIKKQRKKGGKRWGNSSAIFFFDLLHKQISKINGMAVSLLICAATNVM